MAPADLLLAIGLVCVVVAVGMNIVTAARLSGGKAMSKERRIRSAVLTVSIAVVGLVCMVAWFVQS
ncbi:hypothetical protein [Frigoribacterium sp. RIT-PI-h]|uniref:hypothetical protein n=1 Tax=Frigoribacterium sp. RIT-PI-h TaxID=1690245 RepID=UPI00128FB285|nr:hypothetical protein [Frigoribacterium sp. RIT-PI-h]